MNTSATLQFITKLSPLLSMGFSLIFYFLHPIFGDTLNLTAIVPAPLPTSPAIITSLADQEHVTNTPLDISGTCGDGAYVTIHINGSQVGTGSCSGGIFSMTTGLQPGENQLQARVYNITDNEGPQSPLLTIFLDQPSAAAPSPAPLVVPPITLPPTIEIPSPSTTPILKLHYDYRYKVYRPHELWQGTFALESGQQPYNLQVDWGDNNTNTDTIRSAGAFSLSHTFALPGIYKPIVHVTDQAHTTALLQLLVVVKDPQPAATIVPSSVSPETTPILISVGVVVVITTTAELFGATQLLRIGRKK